MLRDKLGLIEDNISIGGEGQFMGSISISYNTDQWTTSADSTGAWVHSKSYDQSGTITVDINQMSPAVIKFIGIVSAYYSVPDLRDGFTLTLKKADSNDTLTIVAEDCRVQKIADQEFDDEAAEQSWTFTSGRISFTGYGNI